MKRKFHIYYNKVAKKWFLSMNGSDVRSFETWNLAIYYLIVHWNCVCLAL